MSFSSFLGSGLEANGNTNPIGLFTLNSSAQSVSLSTVTTITATKPTNIINGVQYVEDWILILKNTSATAITGALSIYDTVPIPGVIGNVYQYLGLTLGQNQQFSLRFKTIKSYAGASTISIPLTFVDSTSGVVYSVVSASCFLVANPSPI
jgi:hypothetical protein